ncbi:hypothetical protein CHU98_g1990 [Xylaria longipes]|nr:hypothetical protein CHU98_g1990 [Xylaria longipes]
MTVDQLLVAIGVVEHIEQSTTDVEKVLQLRKNIHPVAEPTEAAHQTYCLDMLQKFSFHDHYAEKSAVFSTPFKLRTHLAKGDDEAPQGILTRLDGIVTRPVDLVEYVHLDS